MLHSYIFEKYFNISGHFCLFMFLLFWGANEGAFSSRPLSGENLWILQFYCTIRFEKKNIYVFKLDSLLYLFSSIPVPQIKGNNLKIPGGPLNYIAVHTRDHRFFKPTLNKLYPLVKFIPYSSIFAYFFDNFAPKTSITPKTYP